MPKTKLPQWVAHRILTFFNEAQSIDDILDGTIVDDPSDGAGRAMGPSLAARILREKAHLPRRRFSSFDELDSIRGVGEGTIRDLGYSLGVTAAEQFQQSMYDYGIIYRENWTLEYVRAEFDDTETFEALVNDEKKFRHWVFEQIKALSSQRRVSESGQQAMLTQIKSAYIDSYHNGTPAPAYALALWFYEFDADNWFSWEQVQAVCESYINHHMGGPNWGMELRFFRGFEQKDIIRPGITPPDLPVMVNWAEQNVSLWFSALYD